MNRELAKTIGAEARRARTVLRLTQQDAAERVGVSLEFYARIERGGTLPSVPTLRSLANTLGTSPDALLGGPEEPRRPAPTPVAAGDDKARLLRRIVRRLEAADETTLGLVNQLLIGLNQLREAWEAGQKRRR